MSIALSRNIATYDPTKRGNDIKLYNDASENQEGTSGAFADIHDAIQKAKHFIFIADWSFHPYMHLKRDSPPREKSTLGALLIQQACANPEMVIAIHTWDHTNWFMPDWQNDDGDEVLDILTKKLWGADVLKGKCDQKEIKRKRPDNLLWRASSRASKFCIGWSHHQKFVVLDSPGPKNRRIIKVFFGGLDLTEGRFDWSGHHILPSDPESKHFLEQDTRERPHEGFYQYDDWRNPEFKNDHQLVRQPWHDIHAQLVGPAAWDFVREFVGRWMEDPAPLQKCKGAQGDYNSESIEKVIKTFLALFDSKKFVQQWEPHKGMWAAQVHRSMTKEHWGGLFANREKIETPSPNGERQEFVWIVRGSTGSTESSIGTAYLTAIYSAERFIYIETQYLIGSGEHWNRPSVQNRIPVAIVQRILQRWKRKLPFHTYIVLPMFPEGDPTSASVIAQRQFQWATIGYMISTLVKEMGNKWRDYLSFYFLANWNNKEEPLHIKGPREDRVRENERYMIYVHSKFMIVDDRYLIVGSANLNERSLAGDRDTEIATSLWPAQGKQKACMEEVRKFRQQLWLEHLGKKISEKDKAKWEKPESKDCIKAVQQAALQNYEQFYRGNKIDENGHLCMWYISGWGSGIDFPTLIRSAADLRSPTNMAYIPDGVFNEGSPDIRDKWRWIPRYESFITILTKMTQLAE
jgi:phospholipase D1/2